MDTPKPQRRLWPLVVAGAATAAIAFATAGAAASDPDSPSGGKAGEAQVSPTHVLPG